MIKKLTDDERISAAVHDQSKKVLAIMALRIERLVLISESVWYKPTDLLTENQQVTLSALSLAVKKCQLAEISLTETLKQLTLASHAENLHFYAQLCRLSQAMDGIQHELNTADTLLSAPQSAIVSYKTAQRSIRVH